MSHMYTSNNEKFRHVKYSLPIITDFNNRYLVDLMVSIRNKNEDAREESIRIRIPQSHCKVDGKNKYVVALSQSIIEWLEVKPIAERFPEAYEVGVLLAE